MYYAATRAHIVYISLFVLYQGYQLKDKFNIYVLPSYTSIISTKLVELKGTNSCLTKASDQQNYWNLKEQIIA